MQYFITFLEGIITFISPCLLPLLPVYISFFAGDLDRKEGAGAGRSLLKASGFILGFTVLFVALGAAFSAAGQFLSRFGVWVNIVTGLIVIFFGLSYTGLIKWNPFMKVKGARLPGRVVAGGNAVSAGAGAGSGGKRSGLAAEFSGAFLFGLVFSISWTPCVGTFLGSALVLASQQGSVATGIIMLICYSAGLGIPFLICSVLLDRLVNAIAWIKKHYRIINMISV